MLESMMVSIYIYIYIYIYIPLHLLSDPVPRILCNLPDSKNTACDLSL
jgi:hypothetical protein